MYRKWSSKYTHVHVYIISKRYWGETILSPQNPGEYWGESPCCPCGVGAFDTVDHEILLQRLHLSFGVSGTLLSWLTSFLSERSMCAVHGLSRSSWVPAAYGLPQGSVLGPLLYIIYTSDIASLLAPQAMLGQLYADDVQAYQHCPASDALVTVSAMSRTMEALGSWMSSNRLRLNPHKTQFIWLGTRQQLAKLDMVALTSAFPH